MSDSQLGLFLVMKQADAVVQRLGRLEPAHGLYPLQYNVVTGASVGKSISFGATGDSFYEYLLKAWIQVGQHARMANTRCHCYCHYQ